MWSHFHHNSPCFSASIFHVPLRLNPNPKPNPTTALPLSPPSPLKSLFFSSSHCSQEIKSRATPSSSTSDESPLTIDAPTSSDLSRRQNAKSVALFLLHSQGAALQSIIQEEEDEDQQEIQRKRIIEEASLATRRVARFPGSIDFPKPDQLSLALDFNRAELGSDYEVIRKALEVRRGVAAEILKEALRAGKLSINYSRNLVSRLGGFVDRVVIAAAAMKGVSEFSHVSFNVRAKNYIHSSGVVALVKWLKHNSMSYPQIGKVICLCSGNLERVREVAEWLKSINVKGENLGAVFVKASPILERSLEEMDDIVNYLMDNGVKQEWVGYVVARCPQLLILTMEELITCVKFYVNMGMNKKDFGTMVFEYPRVLGFFNLDEMNSKVQYLKEFGLNTEDVGRLLAFRPQLMGCSIEERWKPLVKYLYYLGVRRDGMKRILMVKPMIFCVGLETTIAPKVRFLQDLGIKQEAIANAIVKFPPLLTYSLYKKIRPVVIFLITKASVAREDIAKVIASDPQLVGCNIVNKLEVNVKYFLSLGIWPKYLGEMIADFPMLLRYNLDILRPKYRYLRQIMVRPLEDLIEFPRFFSYSLEDRIIPRHKVLVDNQVSFKLRYMLSVSDEEFNERVKSAVERRRRFESGEINLGGSDSDPSVGVTS